MPVQTMSMLKIVQRVKIPKLALMIIVIASLISVFLYCMVFSRSSPAHGLASVHRHLANGSVSIATQRTSSGIPSVDPDSVFPDQLPPVEHDDLFTEFDDVVLNGLYGNNEYVIDYRYDGSRTIDEASIANATYSTLRLLDRKTIYQVNDVIRVSIEVHNGYNKRVLRGGDRIRVFIKEVGRGACANGHVIDHRNGTYTGVIRALWAGKVDVVAAIAASREAIQTLYKIHREGHIVRKLFAIFQRRFRYEMTLCSSGPFIPGFTEVCNLTSLHDGLPWYCGHPEVMTCAEWTRIGASQPPWPLSSEERKVFETYNSHQNIRQSADVVVANSKVAVASADTRELIACNELPASSTWTQAPPVGYFSNWRWRSTLCVNTLPNTVRSWDECLSSRTMWLHGDSTLRQWFSYIKLRQNLELVTEKWRYDTWPLPSTLYNKGHNYAVFWATHELPFTNSGEFVPIEAHKATHAYIDELPRGSRDVIVIHLYLHFTAYPPTLLRTHVRRTVQAVKSLLQRAPDVRVFVKGSHAFYDYSYARGVIDDYWGTIHDQIFKKEFEELKDKVYFLDFWDMTVASENTGVHPNRTLVEQMMHTMMGYICP